MKILFFGDSITDMGRKRDVEDGHVRSYGDGYVFLLASKLISKDPLKYEIVNRGNGGNRIVDLYARIKSDVWNEKPDVLSILIGVNDVWHELGEKPNGVELNRWENIYRLIIEETRERLPNIKIILCEPFVLHGIVTDANDRYNEFEKVKKYAEKVRELAKEYGLNFVALQEEFDKMAEKNSPEKYLYDGVHPAIAGATLIANEWYKVFSEIEAEE